MVPFVVRAPAGSPEYQNCHGWGEGAVRLLFFCLVKHLTGRNAASWHRMGHCTANARSWL